ncbi:hypothetical protein EBT16_00625 [bacterium]|nr:hypothetical protein [bacterium]
MLHTISGSYKELARLVPGLEGRSPSVRNKSKLREIAERGDPRPSQKTKIGRSLSDYTSPANRSYDPLFHRDMKKIRPEWFMSQTQVASGKKKELLKMARRGDPRPSYDKTKIGQALSNYTRKKSPAYDPVFDKQIRKLRPDWFLK